MPCARPLLPRLRPWQFAQAAGRHRSRERPGRGDDSQMMSPRGAPALSAENYLREYFLFGPGCLSSRRDEAVPIWPIGIDRKAFTEISKFGAVRNKCT